MTSIALPTASGDVLSYTPGSSAGFARPLTPLRSRVCYAAAHVVADPLNEPDGSGRARLDWDATLAYREHLWSYGLRVADAMDTAQRGMGVDWEVTIELVRRSAAHAQAVGGQLACGAGTDQLPPGPASLEGIEAAYLRQCEVIEDAGAQVVVMASRQLAATARGPEDYLRVYSAVLSRLGRPAILHWLGEAFDPTLAGYWGSHDIGLAAATVLDLIAAHTDRIDGIKTSLLDAPFEIALRRRLPPGVVLYTGDDWNYPELMAGDELGASHALLGIFDAIAPAASAAVQALDRGDTERFAEILAPTVPLARHIFRSPIPSYKTGIVFVAYLNGHQQHFKMVGGQEGARSVVHLAEIFTLADRAGLLADPDLATCRMRRVLALAGVEQ
jgi:hypothetical protein